jgi:hypothetical protein
MFWMNNFEKISVHYKDLFFFIQVFVSVKAINGAGLSSHATSNGIYISYLSQGRPPLSHIGVIDMVNGEHIDV